MAAIICLGVPLIAAGYLAVLIYLGINSTKWPSVKGKKIKYEITEQTLRVKFPSVQDDVVAGTVRLKYEYVVGNRIYRSSRISYLNKNYGAIEDLESDALLSSVKNDDFVVYYFDKFPQISVLRPGFEDLEANIGSIVMIIFGGALIYLLYKLAWSHLSLPPPKYYR